MLYKVYGSQKKGKKANKREEKQLYSNDLDLRTHITLTNFSNNNKKKRNQLHEVDQNHLFSQQRKRKSNNNKDN